MKSNDILKSIDAKTLTSYFDDIISIEDFHLDRQKII